MKFRLSLLVFTFGVSAWGGPTTVPIYINSGTVVSPPNSAPQIDAVTFVNEGYFEVNDFAANPLPYETANTRYFTNSLSGIMLGYPGYFFEYVSGNIRGPMTIWENRGSISSFGNVSNSLTAITAPNWLLVDSTSILNSGSLNASGSGLIRLSGSTVNLVRGRMRTGSPLQNVFYSGAFYLYETNYFNDAGITDLYWGGGTNNTLGGSGQEMILNLTAPFSTPNFTIDNVRSASHSVAQRSQFTGTLFTNNFNVLPSFSKGVVGSTYVTTIGNEMFIQTVFVATNFFDTNLTPEVTFIPSFGGPAIAQVGFKSVEHDIALDQDIESWLYLIDGLATETNVILARNFQLNSNTRRPHTYAVSKGPYLFGGGGVPGNASYTNFPAYNSTYGTNVVPVIYAAYSAQLTAQTTTGSDPTNYPGRVEITGQNVNLRDSRIRAESTVSITANNLVNTNLSRVSAPWVNFDLSTTLPQLLISNLAPPTVNRLYGTVSAWSAKWDNTDARFPGMNIHFHMMIVDHTLQTTVPVTVTKFYGRAPQIVFHDNLNVNQRLRVDAPNLYIRPSGGITFPASWNWGSSNMWNILNFTNDGVVNVPGTAVLGTDRGYGYSNIINRGTFTAQSFSIQDDYFENLGGIIAQGSNFRFDGRKACLIGQPYVRSVSVTTNFIFFPVPTTNYVTNVVYTGADTITARGNITINANTVIISNTILQAGNSVPGAVIITPGVRLTDGGPLYTNLWLTTGGIRIMARPTSLSDLMGTYATVAAPSGQDVLSTWASTDVGAIANGYSNNLALGKLTLDGAPDSVIRLAGLVDKKKAMYVDYLELLNNATNFDTPDPDSLGLVVDPTLVLYFAHANMDAAKLDGKQNGRIRWVKGFMGPLSTTNIVYPSGAVYPVNISLARHKDFDSDGDGTPNFKDPTPVYSPESVKLGIGRDAQTTNRVLLSWQVLSNSTSYVEYKSPISSTGAWQLLRGTTAPANMRMTMTDQAIGAGRTQRIYRVRVDLPPL